MDIKSVRYENNLKYRLAHGQSPKMIGRVGRPKKYNSDEERKKKMRSYYYNSKSRYLYYQSNRKQMKSFLSKIGKIPTDYFE